MAYQVYWIAGSPYAWRVLLAMEIKVLEYESKLLQADKKEHKSSEYLDINPRGRVPSLTFDGEVVYESVAILAYLESKHPQPPLFGQSSIETGLIWQSIYETDSYIIIPVFKIVRPVYFNEIEEHKDEIMAVKETVLEEFAMLERKLTASNYLVGDSLSAADIVLFPVIMSLQRALTLELGVALNLEFLPYEKTFPAIDVWVKRIESIPGYAKTYPPIWND